MAGSADRVLTALWKIDSQSFFSPPQGPSIMTDDEARQEARRRWGARGKAERWQHQIGPISKLFVVGRHVQFVFEVFGEGDTWEEAFDNANHHIAAKDALP